MKRHGNRAGGSRPGVDDHKDETVCDDGLRILARIIARHLTSPNAARFKADGEASTVTPDGHRR
jgi:hypothetical protein